MPESFTNPCECACAPGTVAPSIAPYVVSLNSLNGIVAIAPDGGVSVRTSGNTIFIGANGSAGLGTVTSANATSSNNNLVVTGGPITTTGTFQFSLAGALNSISGLVTAADKMIYTTALNTYAVTDLTSFSRTLLDDANSTAAQSTLGLVIGTNVQAWNADLDSFVANSSYSGSDLTVAGDIILSAGELFSTGNITTNNNLIVDVDATITGDLVAGTLTGDGAGITGITAANISAGTLAVARGGTGLASYTTGDLIYASAGTTLSKLADVSAGRYLRSGGVGVAPLWSTLTLPNTTTVGDILFCSSSNVITSLADVAVNNVLISGGVGVSPAYGKVTSSHTDGTTIATISSSTNSNILNFANAITFNSGATMSGDLNITGAIQDPSPSPGNNGEILTSTGTSILWSNQISLDTLSINTAFSISGTITAGGSTGAKTINKPSGTVRFAAAATSLVVTNNLCTTSSRVLACVCTNDTTAYVKNVTTTTGSFTIVLGAAATAETEVYWVLHQII